MDMDHALSRCPFLHNLCQTQGRSFATSIATNPLLPASSAPRRPILQEEHDFAATFRLFHGPGGVVPLARAASIIPSSRPAELLAPSEPQLAVAKSHTMSDVSRPRAKHPLAGAPLATMSLSGMPDFGDLFRQLTSRHQPKVRKPLNGKAAASGSGSQALQPPANSTAFPSGSASSAGAPAGGTCPLRKLLGPTLAGVVFNKAGHLQCPAPIVQARAALAATAPVKNLRPQALPVKLLAVGAVAALVNVPFGMVREHTEKFSLQWILAVHASIPFIALLRKAVIMPKLAIVCTIAAAIAGQAIGARMERQRLQQLAEQEQVAGAARPEAALHQAAGQPGTRKPAPAVRGKVRVARGGSGLRTTHSEQQPMQQFPLGGADWRMDRPGTGSFKQLVMAH